ncbi:MAG TPA: rRNA maturation RNase YbeY [Planctomycetota bacterium]|nr:rRNA maturation RNase YbeY [Planctomycetota bacterium]
MKKCCEATQETRAGGRVFLSRRDRRAPFSWPPLRKVLLRLLADHSVGGTLSLAVVGDGEIQRVHQEFLGLDTPTDVLSFALGPADGSGPGGLFGEVVVSAEAALREARRRGLLPEEELALYAIHGALHLVGFDDLDPASRRAMRRAERRYLALHTALRAPGEGLAAPSRRRPGLPGRARGRTERAP